MTSTIHRNFKQVADAKNARQALLASGFQPAHVIFHDHTTPAPLSTAASAVTNMFDALVPGGPAAAAKARHRAGALLSIDIDDDRELEKAEAIMQRYGAEEA
jgi:hypothetical protein